MSRTAAGDRWLATWFYRATMPRILRSLGVMLVLSVGVASADDYQAFMQVRNLASRLEKARAKLDAGKGATKFCRDELAKSKTSGAKPDEPIYHEVFEGMAKAFKDKQDRWSIHFADAGQICDELDRIEPAARAVVQLSETARHLESLRNAADDPSYVSAKTLEVIKAMLVECRASINTLVPIAKAYKLTEIEFSSGPRKLATLGADICDAMDKQIPAYQKLVEAAAAAAKIEWEKTLDAYRKAGADGEKLQFLGSMDGTALYAIGGKELMTPKAKAAASVMFEVLTGDGVTIRRYTWKGNKSTGMSQREYPARPGASAFK